MASLRQYTHTQLHEALERVIADASEQREQRAIQTLRRIENQYARTVER